MTPAVEIRDLFRVYASPEGQAAALQGLSLSVHERQIVVLLGPSGAGKTSLLRIVAGLDRPSAGSARVLGTELQRLSGRSLSRYRAATLGYVDQHYSQMLPPELRVDEAVSLRLRLLGVPPRLRRARADELLERVGLGDRRRARPGELSGGEQQRVAVCAGLAHNPRLLLADEPTGELDAASASLVYETIADLVRGHGCTALVVSHDRASTAIADRVVHIRDGRVAEETRLGAGDEAIVVGRGGWLRIPEEVLAQARIGTLARATLDGERIVLSRAEGSSPADGRSAPAVARVQFDSLAPAGRGGVELRAVTKTYGTGAARTTPLTGLTASLAPHRFHAVTGPSGSGKTTLLQLVGGLELPTSGEVSVGGATVSALDREQRALLRAASIGVVGQHVGLVSFLSARENVELGLFIRGRRDGASARATRALAAVGLADRMEARVSRLSSGEQARVAIARAVAAGPAVLLADEPTSRLDGASAVAIASLFRRLSSELGMTVICATHDPLVVEAADTELALATGLS